jgi:hypothetical protein
MTLTQRLLPRAWVQAYDITRLFEGPLWEQAALAAVAAILAPVCEELTFRGYLQSTLSLRRGPAGAIAVGAFLFATLHLDPVRFPALLVLGTVFGWLTWRAGSVWPAVAAHAANNGLAAGLLLALGATEAPAAPAREIATTLAVGLCALGLLLGAYRAAAGWPPPDGPVALVDPASPDLRWRAGRVPRPLALLAAAGGLTLLALAVIGLGRGALR